MKGEDFMRRIRDERGVYDPIVLSDQMENDELDPREEAFVRGYMAELDGEFDRLYSDEDYEYENS